ncbi:MAG: aspartate/tyrosine/aromatic aminotransferase [Oscillospiraceae bacterium]|nr:aspartate/tyrosine/aromatic aminotransferase [Oscillospiraceae bacterium]
MKELSKTISAIQGSSIRKMFNMAQQMDDLVSFALGEPGYTAAAHISAAAIQAIQEGNTHYTVNAGILPLREALSQKMELKKRVNYDPETEIMVTSGGVEALYLSMKVMLDPGDEVLLGAPYFPNYLGQIQMCGAVPRIVPLLEEDGFQYNVRRLRESITERTKLLLLNSPSNPTGSVTGEAILKEIAQLCIEQDLYVITDEVYQDFIYGDTKYYSIASYPGMKERTVIVDSFSKTYAMTGWRCGIVLGPQALVSQMVKIQENVVSCVNTPTQYGALAALEGSDETIRAMTEQYDCNRQLVTQEINSMPGLSCVAPQGAFYAFINVKQTGLTSEEFAIRLLKEGRVVVVPGSGFGEAGEGYIRISYVSSKEDTVKGLERIRAFMKQLMEEKHRG